MPRLPYLRGTSLLAVLLTAPLYAQTHRVAAPERVTRAVAVYEWTGDRAKPDAARLVPVSLFIEGHLEDAGVYLTQPLPFALQTGTVYSVEEAGRAEGNLNLDYARDIVTRRSATDDNPVRAWFGYGSFVPASAEPRPPAPPAPAIASTGDLPAADPDRPVLRHRGSKQDAQKHKAESASSVTGMNTSLNDDPNRPTMRRGKPTGPSPSSELQNLPPHLHQAVAVSDAVDRKPQLFTGAWTTPTERAETLLQLEALAQPRIAAYVETNHLSLSAPPPFSLSSEQLTPYTLSDDGLPTFVYMAEVALAEGGPVYLTLIAQRVATGDLHISLASITDALHLDRTPWMRLVDAVDPDAGHRAGLLFELRAQSTRQFALYRLTSATAEQEFVSSVIQ